MAKQLNVNLSFTADTAKAREQIQALQNQLNQLTTQQNFKNNFTLTDELQKSFTVATQLKQSLNDAINVNTGKLDLGKFASSMKQNNMSLEKYREALTQLGPQGTQAFASLANSITQAEIPIKRSNAMLTEMFTTLKNTARWQISSSILHGFMGTIQHAYGYAQDLNESLNNIRIVTGQSVEQMAKFAEQANKAAKALSTTTTEYTNASLIYYQQGLSDAEVKERTDVTVKMANAAGVNAQIVSDQMTAVWNNFDDGSKSLEYYADVMTALGAATASSTDEIAAGLEKFAAVSETVGLSYEYATAALATVTATTRQSADVVGNAFKTLFARIQGLNLGETLDDGTTLNKYSSALLKIGIDIKDQNNQIKEMDTILDELGNKWKTIDKDQQIALAQTVAGVRQYTQLMALMDNWDYFGENLQVALGSEGELNKQADIYAESWDAAKDRVQASAESIYSALLDDKFFISLNNGFAKFLDVIKTTIDSLGGVKGILLVISGIITTTFAKEAAQGIDNFAYSLKMMTKKGRESISQMRSEANEELQKLVSNKDTKSGAALASAYQSQGKLQQAYIDNASRMSDIQKGIAVSMLDQQRAMIENVRLAGQVLEAAEKQEAYDKRKAVAAAIKADQTTNKGTPERRQTITTQISELQEVAKEAAKIDAVFRKLGDINLKLPISSEIERFRMGLEKANITAENFEKIYGTEAAQAFTEFQAALNNSSTTPDQLKTALENLFITMDQGEDQTASLKTGIMNLLGVTDPTTEEFKELDRVLTKIIGSAQATGEAEAELAQKSSLLTSYTENMAKSFENLIKSKQTLGQSLTALAGQLSSVAMGITSVINLIKTWNNDDATPGEKILATMTTLGIVIPIVIKAFDASTLSIMAHVGATVAAKLGWTGVAGALTAAGDAAVMTTAQMWAAVGVTAAIAAAIVAVVAVVWLLVQSYNSAANAAKEAAEAAIQAKEAFEDTKTSVEDLKNSLEGIDEQRFALESMTKGTDEWREAVVALNDEILALIDMYPELAAAVSKNADGVLEIDKTSNAYKEFKKQQEKQLQNSRQSYLGAAVHANNMQNISDTTDVARDITYMTGVGRSAHLAQATNSEIETVVKALQETDNTILKDKETFSNSLDEDYGISNQALIDALWSNKDSLVELSASIQANTTANELFNQQIAASYLEEESGIYNNSNNKTAMEKAAAEGLSGEDKSTWGKTYVDSSGVVLNDRKVQQAYAAAMGYSWVANRNGGIGEYVNASGETLKIDDSTARYYLNQQDALKKYTDMAEEANQFIEDNIDNNVEGIQDQKAIFEAALTGDYKGLNENQLAIEGNAIDLLNQMGFDGTVDENGQYTGEIAQLVEYFGEDFVANIQAALDAAVESVPKEIFDLSSWKNQITALRDLNIGDTIDSETFTQLDANMQQFFTKTLDGEYMLIDAADQLTGKLKDQLQNEIEAQQNQLDVIQDKFSQDDIDSIGDVARERFDSQGSQGYDSEQYNRQLSFIDEMGGDTAFLRERISDGEITQEDIQAIAEAATQAKINYDELTQSYENNRQALALSANTVNELDQLMLEGSINATHYAEAFMQVAYKEADDLGIDTEELQDYSDYLEENVEGLKNNSTEALRLALAHKKMNKGLQNLSDNWEEYNELLSSDSLEDNAKAVKGLQKDMANLLNVDPSTLSESWLTNKENLELMEEAVNGNLEAIDKLRLSAAQEAIKINIDDESFNGDLSAINNELSAFQAEFGNVEIGTSVDTSSALEGLWNLYESGQMSAQGIQEAFDALGWDPDLKTETYTLSDEDVSRGYIQVPTSIDPLVIENVPIDSSLSSGMTVSYPVLQSKNATYRGSGTSTATGPKKTGGGGGGGSRKPPEKKNDTDKTRYHTLQNQLEDLKSEYDEIAEASDRAFGADKLKAMDEEIAKTDELIDKQEEYIDAISADLPKDKAIMTAYYDDVIDGPAIEFDEKGNISNYDAIQDAMWATYNKNADSMGETEWEVFEKKYEQLEKYIEQYEETYDLLRDEETALQELINQRIDQQLEKVQYEVELKLNVSDDSLAVIEFQLDMLGDNAYRAAEAIEYQTEQAEILYDKMQANEQGLKDVLATSDMSVQEIQQLLEGDTSVLNGHTFTEAQMEAIREYRDNLLDLSQELQEVREEVQQRLLDAFDEWNEELDEGIEKFDHYNTLMENFKNIIDIVGQDYLKVDNAMMGSLNQANVDNRINKVTATKDALEALLKTEAEAMEQYNAAIERGNQNDIDYWKETLDVIGEEVTSAQEEMMTAWEEALQAAAEAFEQAVELAIDNFEKALLPFGTLDEFSDAYDKQKEVADQYLDDYQQIYELSKLNRDINNSIDDTKSIAGKQKLKGLLDDINELQEEGTQLSEYDLDYLQKTYDLRLAEIALEEAQKAKNTVRLTRDNEGNFSYAYTINDDAADDAAQKYEDALYAMQETSSEYIDEMSEQLISTSKEMEEALAAVRVEDYASIEEYYAKLDEIQTYYLDRMTYMQGEMQKALDNNKALYEQDWQNYSMATGYKISDDENFAMSYKDTVLGTLFGSESDLVDFQERVNTALGDEESGLIGELLNAYIAWSKNTDRAMEEAGTSSEDFATDMSDAVYGDGGIMDSSEEATEAVEDMAIKMVAGFDTISSAIERWQTQAGDAADAVIKQYLDVVSAYNLMVKALSTPAGSQKAETQLSDIVYSGDEDVHIDPSVGRFATGGYTGSWGDVPKWALLDEKELVLNADDTSNFLQAIQLTRSMLNTIDLNAQSASNAFGAVAAGLIGDTSSQVLEQDVHITAEFPNVTDHYEIEEALNNLINTSSQYANRK